MSRIQHKHKHVRKILNVKNRARGMKTITADYYCKERSEE
jgi:hypothetical protein